MSVEPIAPPKTNANSSTNMIGEISVKTRMSGTRRIFFRLRRAMVTPSPDGLAHERSATASSTSSSSSAVLGGVTGQVQEHVVQRGASQTDLVEAYAGLPEPSEELDQVVGAAVDGQR